MRTRFAVVVAGLLALGAGPAHAITLDEILAKHIEARGGLANLRALKSVRATGKVRFGGGNFTVDVDYAQLRARPSLYRDEGTLQGLTQINAWDGKGGWTVSPFQGRKDPQHTSADDAKNLAQQADLDGPLVDWQQKGHKVEYLGTEDIDGTAAYKIRVALKDGDIQTIYIDPDAFLTIRVVQQSFVRGAESVQETDFGSYQQVNGVWLPAAIDSGPKGQPKGFHVTFDRFDANGGVDDTLFQFPVGHPATRAILPGQGKQEASTAPNPPAKEGPTPTFDAGVLSGLRARNIGSATMSGRIAAVAARVIDGKTLLFVGAASGGVWKSFDGGTTFKPVFDKEPVQSIGAITIDPSDPKTIWVGSGEAWTRNSTSIGDGIYKSTDGGETWTNMGLKESERIVRIVVHPKNSNVVYACVPGKLWSDSADRGLYKTTDGGKTWALILKGSNLSTGCSSIAMDPKNPELLFAGLWDFRRKGWTFRSGGDGPDAASGSGFFRSADGGKTWSSLTEKTAKGLPAQPWGRVETAIAPSDNKIIYTFIESKDSALYRSSDGGQTWEARDKSQFMVWRPFYFARLIVDPTNPEKVFKCDFNLIVSVDGGKSFSNSAGNGGHGDWHDVWIDPTNPQHVIGGDDGGLWLSQDGGSRWWKEQNLPVSQFYHVTVDNLDPYKVYGGLQDNSSWVGDSEYPGGITNNRWENLFNGDGFHTLVDPSDPNYIYAEYQGGQIGRVDRRSLVSRTIQPLANFKEKLRFNWNTPIAASPTKKGTIYIGAQFLFRSTNHGDNWDRISPDLSTNDPEKQKQEQSGGVTVDNSSAEMHTTIVTIAESPLDSKVIWAGTDDGNVQLTRDSGKTWTNVVGNVTGLPKSSWVTTIEASRFDAGTAYATFDRHTFGDMTPWAYKTTDFGKTWTRIAGPEQGVRGYAHVIREDTVKKSLLFLGTELGLWISVDGGGHWAEFKGGDFPAVAVRDMVVQARESDLVLATHGRGIWILGDLTPLRAVTPDVLGKAAAFLPTGKTQQRMGANGGWAEGDATYYGENPPGGMNITFYQRSRHLYGQIKLEILDDKGKVIDTLNPPKRRGLNQVTWSMRMKPPNVPRAAQIAFGSSQGPRVLPGTYTARLTKGGETVETKIKVDLDKRAPFTVADRKAQLEATLRAGALFDNMTELVENLDAARSGAASAARKLGKDPLAEKVTALGARLEAVKKEIVATKEGGAITGEERIREHLDQLYGALNNWEGRPGKYQLDRIDVLKRELDGVKKEFDEIAAKDLPAIDEELQKHSIPPIPVTASREKNDDDANGVLTEATVRCVESNGSECQGTTAAAMERD